jgi:hypothetical protein
VNRLSNAWRLSKSSWQVLSHDRELIALPVIAGIAAVVAFLAIFGPGAVLLGGTSDDGATNWAIGVIAVIAGAIATWIAALGQAAVVAGASQRMDGQDPTIGSAWAAARSRAGRILEWAILATVVSVILDQIEERLGILGRIVSWIGSVAFAVMSFLALPVIVFEDLGAIAAFKRSSQLLKQTWGEQVAFTFGMGLLGLLLAIPAIVVGGLLLATGIVVLQAIAVVAIVLWIGLVMAVTSALSAVFKAALYRYAVGKPVDPVFAPTDLSGAFQRR